MNFIRLLGDPSLCPRLHHISYTAYYPHRLQPEKLDESAEEIGKLLTECVQSRRQTYGDALKFITFGNCPPLPDLWLQELERLGTTIVTAENIENVITGLESESGSEWDSEPGSEPEYSASHSASEED